ncbi:MAG: phosphoribosylamine--glycine ligase [Quadrisphaera sp.]
MKVLVIGTGAREHALARSLASDEAVTAVWVAPGGPGPAAEPGVLGCLPVDPCDGDAVTALAQELGVDLVVVGPEAPLVAGVADAVRAAGIACFGPSAHAAELEGSKAFAKQVMAAAGVPTAMARVCSTVEEVAEALDLFGAPHVVKDDGLAAGKGVVVTSSREEALEHAAACLSRAGAQVVVEDFLDGPEVSLFVLSDGTSVVPLAPAQDFKRALDGDEGPNTGGMGAYSPLPWAPEGLVDEVVERVAQPVVDEMRRRGTPFAGVLYCGLALTSRGVRVVEFNARFGDPETQVVLARLRTPLGALLQACATARLSEHLADVGPLRWSRGAAVVVVLAAPGYPASAQTGGALTGAEAGEAGRGAWVLHAGTALDADGQLVSAGGRVLSVVGSGADLAAARSAAYERLAAVSLEGGQWRTDIAAAAAEGALTVR